MTIDELAALAQIVASVAVVASLIYVAKQLGQNSAMMRIAASNERLQRDWDLVTDLIQSREITDIWLKGESELESLNESDRTRLIFFERRAILHWHSMFGLRLEGLLPDSDWHELKWAIVKFSHRQAVREAWKLFSESFEQPFREFIQSQFEMADAKNS